MMKRAMAFFLLLALLLPAMALADDTVVAWSDIAAQIATGENGTVDDLVYVRVKNSTYTISTASGVPQGVQAVISGVQIDARDKAARQYYERPGTEIPDNIAPSPEGTYVFENVAIDGDIRVFAYEWYDSAHDQRYMKQDKNSPTLQFSPACHYTVRLEESVTLSDDAQIEIIAGDDVTMDKRGTQWHSFHGGRVDFAMRCAADDVDLLSECQGMIDAEIAGQTNSIHVEGYNGAEATLRNFAKDGEENAQSGSLYVTIGRNSTGVVTNERDVTTMTLECVEDSKLTAENGEGAEVGMLNVHSEVRSHVKFTNDGVILNAYGLDGNSWGDQAMELVIDETSHLNMVGKGTIMPGYQWFDYYIGDSDMKFPKPRPGASIIIDLSRSSFELSSYAQNVEMARKVANRISLDWDQIERGRQGFTWQYSDGSEPSPHSVLAVYRDERAFIWPVTKNNAYHPALESERELDELPADYDATGEERADAPKVLMNGRVSDDTDVYLSVDHQGEGSGVVRYELEMINAWGDAYDPGKTVELFLPYPDIPDAAAREYEVHHTLKDGTVEYYSTLNGTLRRLDNGKGMALEVRTFSPFEIRWDEGGGSLPDTGDHSRLALWLALACAACAALAMRRRSAA